VGVPNDEIIVLPSISSMVPVDLNGKANGIILIPILIILPKCGQEGLRAVVRGICVDLGHGVAIVDCTIARHQIEPGGVGGAKHQECV
jgi:predicted amidohydrolase